MTVMVLGARVAAAILILACLSGGSGHAASKPELRSFTAPAARDDDRPRPDRAPLVGVEQRLLPPPGAWDTPPGIGDSVFALACFVGYYVVWRVTPALHSPLMSVTNAVSSVIIVGALIATGSTAGFTFSTMLGFLAVILASVNIFGGFIVTQRMLAMYKKKQKKA